MLTKPKIFILEKKYKIYYVSIFKQISHYFVYLEITTNIYKKILKYAIIQSHLFTLQYTGCTSEGVTILEGRCCTPSRFGIT